MNDDLERRLRDGLRRGALPAAPDALRERLSRLPTESRGSRLTGLVSGLRLAALASAAAVVIAFVLVVRSLPNPTGTGPVASLGSIATGPLASSSALATSSPGNDRPSQPPSASPTQPVTSVPTTQPSIEPGFTCAATTVLPATTSAVVSITDTRVGTHAGYDRIVFEFAGTERPRLTVDVASPPFDQDASGLPVKVAGSVFLKLRLYDASGYPTYTGPDSFSPGYPNLIALVNTGDYEGYVTWIAGLNGPACYRIATLTGPTRIVVDVQAP
jgi:hypothetical protein